METPPINLTINVRITVPNTLRIWLSDELLSSDAKATLYADLCSWIFAHVPPTLCGFDLEVQINAKE